MLTNFFCNLVEEVKVCFSSIHKFVVSKESLEDRNAISFLQRVKIYKEA